MVVAAHHREAESRRCRSEHAPVALRTAQPQIREATLPQNSRPENVARYLSDPFSMRAAAGGPNNLGRQYREPLFLIMGVVALVLLIACANIANLLLARASARRHELSVRVALGASRWRIARQLLVESTVLSAAGALLGLAFARWGAALLVRELSVDDPPVTLDVGIDWIVLVFTALVAMATTLLFGTVPALRATRVQPNDALKAQGRSIVGESRFGFGSAMVILQVALSLVLVVGAGLFIRTFTSLAHVRLGFNPDPILIVNMNAKRSGVAQENRPDLWERMRQAALSVPGVQSAALQSITPMTFSGWNTLIENPPGVALGEDQRLVDVNAVSRNWFSTQEIAFIAGRDFTDARQKGRPVVIVVERDAREEVLRRRQRARTDRSARSCARAKQRRTSTSSASCATRCTSRSREPDASDDVPARAADGDAGTGHGTGHGHGGTDRAFESLRSLREGLPGHVDTQSRRGAAARRQ